MLFSLPWPLRSSATPSGDGNASNDAPDDIQSRQNEFLTLLQHYDPVNASNIPPSARIVPSLRQQQRQPFRLLDLWKYGAFVAVKAGEVMADIVSHFIRGPRRKTWGWEMTLITSFMRNVGNHSHLADITMLRALISLAGFVPLPSDAMVTPVTFRVKKRKMRGLLAESADAEDGSRELSGEWVVGRELWKRLQAEWRSSQNDKSNIGHKNIRHRKDRVILYLHGGAYYMFSAATHRQLTIQLSKYTDARVFAVDYRLAPETRFPGQLHDAVTTYLRLLEDLHVPPENILIAGDSAGAGLSLALLMYLRDNDYPLPSGAILMSPWVDLTMSCDSWDRNAPFDVVPMPKPGDHLNPISCYLGDDLEKYVTHPYASPLFGDFHDLPPLLIQSGDAEVLMDEITLLAHKASVAGVTVKHELYEDAVHVFQTFPFLETAWRALLSCRDFVKNVLPARQGGSPRRLEKSIKAGLGREIDNDKARPVRGDGQEMNDGRQVHLVDEESPDDSSEHGSDVERPSWTRRNSQFLIPSSAEGSSGSRTDKRASHLSPKNHHSQLSLVSKSSASSLNHPTTVAPESEQSSSKRPRNHLRRATGGSMRTLAMSPSFSVAPLPTIRSRSRALSHPDISSLCQQLADAGPANQTTRYASISHSNDKVPS